MCKGCREFSVNSPARLRFTAPPFYSRQGADLVSRDVWGPSGNAVHEGGRQAMGRASGAANLLLRCIARASFPRNAGA